MNNQGNKNIVYRIIKVFLKGGLIGIANIIPGVSGGTFALILGIFQRFIGALNALGFETLRVLARAIAHPFRADTRKSLVKEWLRIDGTFLTLIAVGAFAAILSTSFLIDYLLRYHPSPTLAFFIGLILPSIAIPWSYVRKRNIARLLCILPGIALTVGISFLMPDELAGSDNLFIAVIIGAIAISAMILPGLSGSYVMLVMGQYHNVIGKITEIQRGIRDGVVELDSVVWLLSLVAGIVGGIIVFSRFLHLLLKRYTSATMMFLIGLLLGSLWILWPFKDIHSGAMIKNGQGEVKQEIQIATAPNRLPQTAAEALPAAVSFIAGLAGSICVITIGRRLENKEEF